MIKFATAQKALPASLPAVFIAVIYAAVLVVLAVAQLFSFEEFTKILPPLLISLGGVTAAAAAPVIVALEVGSIPFLLRMSLSTAFRWLCLLCSWLVPFFWLALSLGNLMGGGNDLSVGLLGDIIAVKGWVALAASLILALLSALATYSLWPISRSSK